MSEGNGSHVGRRMRRKEDPPLLQGKGNFIDDIVLPGMLYAAFVRSTEAHARISSIDASAARAREGVHAVFTGKDVDLEAGLPLAWVPPGVEVNAPEHWPLAKEVAKHVGDPVAVVIGSDKYAVVDAAEDVLVDYDPLPVVVDVEAALEGGPLVHDGLGTNRVHDWSLGGDVESALDAAEVVIERRFVNHRIAGAPIEPRGVIADYRAGDVTVWSSTQIPNFLRIFLAVQLGMTEDRIRVIAPDVGGGFGSKI
jgi:aerobic carbon-monoxide dehydrogenase large subunit